MGIIREKPQPPPFRNLKATLNVNNAIIIVIPKRLKNLESKTKRLKLSS